MGWDYCCCAIPVLNVGAYIILIEQFVLGILVGTLSFATPALVGASVPSFTSFFVLGFGYVFAAIQILGFVGIFKEKPALFRRYVSINMIVLVSGLATTAAFLGVSAGRHNTAVEACIDAFFQSEGGGVVDEEGEGRQICDIFSWVLLGLMGGLWLLLAVVQGYFAVVLRNYGKQQREDHTKYHSIYSTADGEGIRLTDRSGRNQADEWDPRPSTDSWHPNAAVGANSQQYRDEPDDEKKTYEYGYSNTTTGPGAKSSAQEYYNEDGQLKTPGAPPGAVTDDPGPTPHYYGGKSNPSQYSTSPPQYNPAYEGGGSGYGNAPSYTSAPEKAAAHPAEGLMGRKTPRVEYQGSAQPAYDPYYQR